jgi:hypothetical protein
MWTIIEELIHGRFLENELALRHRRVRLKICRIS